MPQLLSITERKRAAVVEALTVTLGNVREAARLLQVGRSSLYRYIERFGIQPEEWRRRTSS